MTRLAWIVLSLLVWSNTAEANGAVVSLLQTGCQFVEPEGKDLQVDPITAAECRAFNSKTAGKRIDTHKVLELKPGKYTFRVENTDVPYELGFYLRAADRDLIPFMPRVSGGGIFKGQSASFTVELTEGDYVYSCPFNPTPDYKLRVK